MLGLRLLFVLEIFIVGRESKCDCGQSEKKKHVLVFWGLMLSDFKERQC